jgi:hypothetical protein
MGEEGQLNSRQVCHYKPFRIVEVAQTVTLETNCESDYFNYVPPAERIRIPNPEITFDHLASNKDVRYVNQNI